MAGRLAIDFGTSNTVIAVWDEARREGIPFHMPDYGRCSSFNQEQVSVIPSLIHYAADQRRWIGNQVLVQNLDESSRTFRWMKRYIAHRNPGKIRLDGREITHFQAGSDFLSTVLLFAVEELAASEEEIALTLPVEAFEHYENWLAEVAETAGISRFRFIDEPSAAALGYGAHIQPGDVYLIFDFGGGTLDVAVVLIETQEEKGINRCCRVLGKAGTDIGGAVIDRWLFEEVLRLHQRSSSEEEVRRLSRALLNECERAKERLSVVERTAISVMNPDTGAVFGAEFTRNTFEDLLDKNEAFTRIDHTIRRAILTAREKGYDEDSIKAVLMVGGSSLIPAIQRAVQRIFGRERVMLNRPLDAVARGAAAFVAGVDFYDYIQHDYSIRYVNPKNGDYEYYPLIKKGTPYPTNGPVARLSVKGTYDNHKQLGLAIFEISERYKSGDSKAMELVFDPSGAARVFELSPDEQKRRTCFWINEHCPTFLVADPPAQKGEPRFEVAFSVDGNKRLLITARDLITGQITHQDYPVIKLS
jgi:molecular chaperone DnaK (HSP70)